MSSSRIRHALACLLTVSIVSLSVMPVQASTGAVFSGRVVQSDGVTPRTGAVVTLLDQKTGRTFESQPTGNSGNFRIDAAPAGGYTLLIDTSEGAFLASNNMQIAKGSNRPVALQLSSNAPNYQGSGGTSGAAAGGSNLLGWIITGGIVVVSLFAIDELTEDDEAPASGF
ncbi:MAG: carboxypeptidase regulatory-like domain-containing protein [bacterium]|nr:carboxypeptidase regulatory-like domain-containing protein [bacterium]